MNVRDEVSQGRSVRVRPLARETNTAPSTIYAKIARGEIKAIRMGRVIIIPPEVAGPLLGIGLKWD